MADAREKSCADIARRVGWLWNEAEHLEDIRPPLAKAMWDEKYALEHQLAYMDGKTLDDALAQVLTAAADASVVENCEGYDGAAIGGRITAALYSIASILREHGASDDGMFTEECLPLKLDPRHKYAAKEDCHE